MNKFKFLFLLAILSDFTFALIARPSFATPQGEPEFCNSLLQGESIPAPTPFAPVLAPELATSIIKSIPRINDYSLMTIELPNQANAKIVLDSQAPWLMHALERFTGHEAATTDQNDIRKFLDFLSGSDLSALVKREPEMYHGDPREVHRDGAPYTLSEWIAAGKRSDLALALIGQSLFETFVKKEARIVLFEDEASRVKNFGLLVQNRNPELLVPNRFEAGFTRASVKVTAAKITSVSVPATNDAKKPQSFTVVDYQGNSHPVNVINRSAVERIAKTERDLIANAADTDLVPVEFYLLPGYLPGGTTTFRIGDSMVHFGSGGWDHPNGVEGVKRYLLNDPWVRRMYLSHRGLNLPPFNIGIKILLPKGKVEEIQKALETEYANFNPETCGFKITSNNCVHNPARIFKSVGVPIETGKIYTDFSSTLFIRNLFLKPTYPVQSVNIYPYAGTELTPAQMRARFPSFLTGEYSIATDRKLSRISKEFRWRYHVAVLLEAINRAGVLGRAQVEDSMRKMLIAESDEQFQFYVDGAAAEGLIDAGTLELTPKGREAYATYQHQYNLDEAILH